MRAQSFPFILVSIIRQADQEGVFLLRLYELFKDVTEIKFEDSEVSCVTDNSANIVKGCVFVCVKGGSFDGHTRAEEAINSGAAAVVTERDLGLERQIIVENSRKCYGELCAAWFGHPERKLKMIGVTGTNGKTTITNVIKNILMNINYVIFIQMSLI